MESENRLYTILASAGGLFCLASALLFQSPVAIIASAAFFFMTIALWRYGYAIVPALTKRAGIVENGRNFEIPPSQDLVVGKSGGNYLATAFLCARLHESASEKDERQRAAFGEMFEHAVSSAGFPFKLCALVSPLDLSSEIEEIKTKRSIAEERKGKLGKSSRDGPEMARLEREIAMWDRQLGYLSGGQKPMDVIFYLSTTASGISKEEAMARARTQASELSVVAGSALSCEISHLKGEDMKRCFWWDFFGPADSDDLRDQLF